MGSHDGKGNIIKSPKRKRKIVIKMASPRRSPQEERGIRVKTLDFREFIPSIWGTKKNKGKNIYPTEMHPSCQSKISF